MFAASVPFPDCCSGAFLRTLMLQGHDAFGEGFRSLEMSISRGYHQREPLEKADRHIRLVVLPGEDAFCRIATANDYDVVIGKDLSGVLCNLDVQTSGTDGWRHSGTNLADPLQHAQTLFAGCARNPGLVRQTLGHDEQNVIHAGVASSLA